MTKSQRDRAQTFTSYLLEGWQDCRFSEDCFVDSLHDSNAYFDEGRLLAQHQAALTLIQGMLSNPQRTEVDWLDLACGRGQIIVHLDKNLSVSERGKLRLVGYDIENSYSQHAEKIANGMGLRSVTFDVGKLSSFWEKSSTTGPWDFITLTNTVHEVAPGSLAEIIARCIQLLKVDGCLFLYDMEKLPTPELGAIPWAAAEMKTILSSLCHSLGCGSYEPAVGCWTHKACNGWNAQINRAHMGLPDDYEGRMGSAIDSTAQMIRQLLQARLERVNKTLSILAEYGPETGEEVEEKESLLYEFWAISQALGAEV